MSGPTVTLTEYQPVKKLSLMEETLASFEVGAGEEGALEFICALEGNRQKRHAAVVLLQATDERFQKFLAKLKDFVAFFEPDNLRKLRDWGRHPANPHYLEVSQRTVAGQPRLEISGPGELVALSPQRALWPPDVDWPVPSVPKRR